MEENFSSSNCGQRDSSPMTHSNLSFQEDLKQENYSLTKQLEHKLKMNEEALSEINSLKGEISMKNAKYKNNNLSLKESQNKQITKLQNEVDELEDTIKNQNEYMNSIKVEIKNNLKKLDSSKSNLTLNETGNNLDEELECIKIEENLKLEIKNIDENLIKNKTEINTIKEEIAELHESIKHKDEFLIELKHKLSELNEEIALKEIELNSLQLAPDNDHKQRGNSLFAEVEDNENVIKKSYINLKLKFKKAKEMILFKDREIKIIEKQKQQFLVKLAEILNQREDMEIKHDYKILEDKIKEAQIKRDQRLQDFKNSLEFDSTCQMYLEAFHEEMQEKEAAFLKKSEEQFLHSISMQNSIKEYYSSLHKYMKTTDELEELKFKKSMHVESKINPENSLKEETNVEEKKNVPITHKSVKICETVLEKEDEILSRNEKLDKMRLTK